MIMFLFKLGDFQFQKPFMFFQGKITTQPSQTTQVVFGVEKNISQKAKLQLRVATRHGWIHWGHFPGHHEDFQMMRSRGVNLKFIQLR